MKRILLSFLVCLGVVLQAQADDFAHVNHNSPGLRTATASGATSITATLYQTADLDLEEIRFGLSAAGADTLKVYAVTAGDTVSTQTLFTAAMGSASTEEWLYNDTTGLRWQPTRPAFIAAGTSVTLTYDNGNAANYSLKLIYRIR